MTLDEAIQTAEDKAKELEKESIRNKEHAREHWQLAKWLKELREYKMKERFSTIAIGNSDSSILDIPDDYEITLESKSNQIIDKSLIRDYKLKSNSKEISSKSVLFNPIVLENELGDKVDIGFHIDKEYKIEY